MVTDGKASTWTSECVFAFEHCSPLGNVTIDVTAEVPLNHEGQRIVRKGNRWYPTMVDIDVESGGAMLHPHEARALARAIIAAADKCDEVDAPDSAPCGHWSPCECKTTPSECGKNICVDGCGEIIAPCNQPKGHIGPCWRSAGASAL